MRVYCLRHRVDDDQILLPDTLQLLPLNDGQDQLEDEDDSDDDMRDYEDDCEGEDEDEDFEDDEMGPAGRRNRLLDELRDLGVDHDEIGEDGEQY